MWEGGRRESKEFRLGTWRYAAAPELGPAARLVVEGGGEGGKPLSPSQPIFRTENVNFRPPAHEVGRVEEGGSSLFG